MKVKVGDEVYDGHEVPVMVILEDTDKENLKNLIEKGHSYYAQFPDDWGDPEKMYDWMGTMGVDNPERIG